MATSTKTWTRRCVVLAAALGMPCAWAADPPGAQPGDDALSCDQIYAQGMTIVKREQEERDKKNQQRKAEQAGLVGLIGAATAAGGMGGTGQAANAAGQGMADRQIAELGNAPTPNLRKERLRQLWTQKQCVRK
jgi:hypothetical protein